MTLVADALAFATEAHAGQLRKGPAQMPYITHPIAVANILWETGERSPIVLAAALLHDTVEDCGVTREQLVKRFGPAVASIVIEVTDEPGLLGAARKDAQVAKAPTLSHGAKRLKLADKTANLTDIVDNPPGWAKRSMQGYTKDAQRVARALGSVSPVLEAKFAAAVARVLAAVGEE